MIDAKRDLIVRENLSDSQQKKLGELLPNFVDNDLTTEFKIELLKYHLITRGHRHFKLQFFHSSERELVSKFHKEYILKRINELKEFLQQSGFRHFKYQEENSGNYDYHRVEIEGGFHYGDLFKIVDFIAPRRINGTSQVDKMRVEYELKQGFSTYDISLRNFDTPFSSSFQLDSSLLYIKDIVFEAYEVKGPMNSRRVRYKRKWLFTTKRTSDKLKLIWTDDFLCFIDKTLFEKFEVNNEIPYSSISVHSALKKRLEVLKALTINNVVNEFKNQKNSAYYNDSRLIREKNRFIVKNYEVPYFLNRLCSLQASIDNPVAKHKFVISKTKELDNGAFGRLSERSIFKFLQEKFSDLKWYEVSDKLFGDPSLFKVKWLNESNESFKAYDIEIVLGSASLKLEVKATRSKEDTVFYLSLAELEEILKDSENYLISRVSFLEEGQSYIGIAVNSEFYVNFFRLSEEAIETIKNSIEEWKEHYNENSIRFTTEHLVPLENTISTRTELKLIPEPQYHQEKYRIEFEEFVDKYFFADVFRVIQTYNAEKEISPYRELFEQMRLDRKFQSAPDPGD